MRRRSTTPTVRDSVAVLVLLLILADIARLYLWDD